EVAQGIQGQLGVVDMRTPALGLAQDAAPGACDRQRGRVPPSIRDLKPPSQDRGAVELSVNFDGDRPNRVMQSYGGVRVAIVRGRFLKAAPLPIGHQCLTVDFETESLGHVIFRGIESPIVKVDISGAVPTATDELSLG